MEMIQKRRNARIYEEWNPIQGMSQADAKAKKAKANAMWDDESDFDPNEMSYDEYLTAKKKERQVIKEDLFNDRMQVKAKEKYGMRLGQLDPQMVDDVSRDIKESMRKNYQRKAFFMEKQMVAEDRGMAAKDIDLRDVLEARLKQALNDAERLEIIMNKTYDYHHRSMYSRKLDQKNQQIHKIRNQLQELELKKLPGAFASGFNL